jgi:cyclopropane fatty-acyl-phospholipid synthase-like methyltransferase
MNFYKKKHPYSKAFYFAQTRSASLAASKYANIIKSYYHPTSVIDFGCGHGSWLKSFDESFSVSELVGVDGSWNSSENMPDEKIRFIPLDLASSNVLPSPKRFDLAMSVEVAEHLPKASAESFVDLISSCSDVVVFGAAITLQGGINHINEQFPSYWAEIFLARKYYPFDIFRQVVWDDFDIPFWYKQNTFLYVKQNSELFKYLLTINIYPIENTQFMNAIHPEFYIRRSNPIRSCVDSLAKIIPPSLMLWLYNSKSRLFS